jgi:UDP-glucose 4-epimerase
MVTGGAGFVGSHIVDALIERGDEVVVVDDLSTGRVEQVNPRAAFHQLDVRSADVVPLVRSWRPDAVCHQAGQMSVGLSVKEPLYDLDINVRGSLQVLEAAAGIDASFVFASTGGALYGDTAQLPTPEGEPAWPLSPYAVSKLAVEHYLHCYHVLRGTRYVALRYGNVYGPRQSPHGEAGVVAIFCARLLSGLRPIINGDGTITRDYVYVSDIVDANLAAIDGHALGPFNVGTGRETSVNQVCEELTRYVGAETQPCYGAPRPGDQRRSALDSTLIEKRLGWTPSVQLSDGLHRTVDWFASKLRARP